MAGPQTRITAGISHTEAQMSTCENPYEIAANIVQTDFQLVTSLLANCQVNWMIS